MQIQNITPNYNNIYTAKKQNTSYVQNDNNLNFGMSAPKSKFFENPLTKFVKNKYEQFTEFLAQNVFGKVLDTKFAKSVVEKTNVNKKFSDNLVSHLSVLGSVILSGLYIKKTLDNKDLDETRKRTLAINQAAVWCVSTVLGYTFDGVINNKVKRFTEKYKIVNQGIGEKLEKYAKGIDIARKVMIFDVVYRYIAPVLVTPIANHIGNQINENKQLQLVGKHD